MTSTKAVAVRLQKLLKQKNMSQYLLCRKVAINRTNTYNIFYGRCKTITLDKLFLLAEGLDMTVREFLDDPVFDKDNIEAD